ncbi:hypothetical protein VHEMI07746 [[Torrubiella] hemipterigena]|uniref:Uncharacterized protein n=1 Tax=[Torrubiella] hemipterigena TaxID=1531966 RepID=A0A0A1TM74_9HYPO|nr:hypothetical protein VHEMI07746 [[Torrubiella] hemipterigena]
MSLDKTKTSEHVHLLAALNYYSRIRFMANLATLIQNATSPRRIVNVGGGGMEGLLDATDLPGLRVTPDMIRGHLSTLITLGIEAIQKTAPKISFIHNYPGTVLTGLYRDMETIPFDPSLAMPLDECGERHLYLATSKRYPSLVQDTVTVRVQGGDDVAIGTTGEFGTGVYSIGSDGEAVSESRAILAQLRQQGMVEEIQRHTMGEFIRILGS